MNSFFPMSGQNPYFHPRSDDFAFLFLSSAMATRSSDNLAIGWAIRDALVGAADDAEAAPPETASFSGRITSTTARRRASFAERHSHTNVSQIGGNRQYTAAE